MAGTSQQMAGRLWTYMVARLQKQAAQHPKGEYSMVVRRDQRPRAASYARFVANYTAWAPDVAANKKKQQFEVSS